MRQCAPNNHILDLVVICMLSPLRMLLLCTASEWMALSLPGCIHPPTHASLSPQCCCCRASSSTCITQTCTRRTPCIVVWFLMGHMLHLHICFRSKGICLTMSPGGRVTSSATALPCSVHASGAGLHVLEGRERYVCMGCIWVLARW